MLEAHANNLGDDPNAIRLRIAARVIEQKRRELGSLFVAGACYGSVAHAAAMPESDVEVTIIVADGMEPGEEHFFVDGIMVECSVVPALLMLASASRVTWIWGLEADAYRYQVVLDDFGAFFEKVRAAAYNLPDSAFGKALSDNWWWVYELKGKVVNAVQAGDRPRAIYTGWEFARAAAMRIALHERQPYESGRTLWRDVISRGYGMQALTDALLSNDLDRMQAGVEAVWARTGGWGKG